MANSGEPAPEMGSDPIVQDRGGFSEFWVEATIGGVWAQIATPKDYHGSFKGFLDFRTSVYHWGSHHLILGAGYNRAFSDATDGSEQVVVETTYRRADLYAGYDFLWRALAVGAKLGIAGHFVTTKTSLNTIEVYSDGDSYGFTKTGTIDSQEYTGFEPGLLLGMNAGLDISRLASFGEDVLRILFIFDYSPRGSRSDFNIGGAVSVGFRGWGKKPQQ